MKYIVNFSALLNVETNFSQILENIKLVSGNSVAPNRDEARLQRIHRAQSSEDIILQHWFSIGSILRAFLEKSHSTNTDAILISKNSFAFFDKIAKIFS